MSRICAKRVMIAAPRSGSGKTTIVCALLSLLKKRGLDPVSYKCGPDYIDPLFHKKILGIDSSNLDIFFAGNGVCDILAACAEKYAVIEGVMGVYDGMSASGTDGSSYEIAAATRTPVILAVDASGVGRTVISLIKGMIADDRQQLIKGIILNRISKGFYNDLCPELEKELAKTRGDIRLLGFLPSDERLGIKSRYLGLKLPDMIEDIRKKTELAAEMLDEYVDISGIISIMESAAEYEAASSDTGVMMPDGTGLTLAVARDDAFCFYYGENLRLFEECGVTLKYFSPMEDERLPEGTDGILLGGGYPEDHLEKLSGNRSMIRSVKDALDAGIPSLAECGGFMYLHKTITDLSGKCYEMVGAVDGDCTYSGHLVRFGYMEVKSVNDNLPPNDLACYLKGMRGHEFHYYDSTTPGDAAAAGKPNKDIKWDCIISQNNGIWGFPHFYYRSCPGFVASFIRKMKEVTDG